MFTAANFIVRNKFVFVALIAVCYFLFAGHKEAPKPSSPWSAQASAPVAADSGAKASMTDRVMKVAGGAAQKLGVQDYTPTAIRDQTVGNMNKTEGALTKVNGNQD